MGAEWELVVPQTFNNVYESMSTLFQMSTTEGWVNIMYAGVDARGVDMQPVRDASPAWVFFFMFFIVVGSFFVMNLFVGVVIDNFNQMRDELGGLSLLTEEQRKWMSTQEMLMRVRPAPKTRRPHGAVRAACFDVVTFPRFDHFIMACILANALVLAMQSFGQSRAMTDVLDALNYAFAAIFTAEAVLKLTGLGVVAYFRDRWNIFDFIIVLGTALGLILKWTTGSSVGSVAMVIRTFRVGRLFRLIRSARGLRTLFQTLLITVPALSNVASLLFLLFFIYAIMGEQLFATAKYGEAYNEQANSVVAPTR
jgi:Ion transport protein.